MAQKPTSCLRLCTYISFMASALYTYMNFLTPLRTIPIELGNERKTDGALLKKKKKGIELKLTTVD